MRRPSQPAAFTKKEIAQLFKTAKRAVQHPGLTILCAPKTKDYGRLLVVTPAKIGSAPERNRIRRRLKALFYEHKLFEHGLDCIIIIKKEGINLGIHQLKELLFKALASFQEK